MVHQFHDALPRGRVIESLGVDVGGHEGGPLVGEVEPAAPEALSEGPQLDAVVPLDVPHGARLPGSKDNTCRVVVLMELDLHGRVSQNEIP